MFKEMEVDLVIAATQKSMEIDLSGYARASLARRLTFIVNKYALKQISDLIPLILYDEAFKAVFISKLVVSVSQMFRDPGMFLSLKHQVYASLKTYPHIEVWVAGCAQGQEAFSLAIMLYEAGLLNRTIIHATDINACSLALARTGALPTPIDENMELQYRQSGGQFTLGEYFVHQGDKQVLREDVLSSIHFVQHDLVKGKMFTAAHLVLCRNVFIYFSDRLQQQVLKRFLKGMIRRGFIVLGPKEMIDGFKCRQYLEVLDRKNNIFKLAIDGVDNLSLIT